MSLLHLKVDRRQLWIVLSYQSIVWSLFFSPMLRASIWMPFLWTASGLLSFLNAVVIHNHMHKGIFRGRRLNRAFRLLISLGALYPASANIPSHNLVHHQFNDDGKPDWASPYYVRFRWHLLNLIHFPNVVGPNTFAGVTRWAKSTKQADFGRQYIAEQVFAFGIAGLALAYDFWPALFFIVMPQLWGARGILRINLIQHGGCDVESQWNHSRNFTGRLFNWWMCNNGFHTIHHNRAGLPWSVLREHHDKECTGKVHPALNEKSMVWYLLRTFFLRIEPPTPIKDHEPVLHEVHQVRDQLRVAAEHAYLAE